MTAANGNELIKIFIRSVKIAEIAAMSPLSGNLQHGVARGLLALAEQVRARLTPTK